jgi:hypothetical protein
MSPLVLDFIKSAVLPAAVVAGLSFLIGGRNDPFRARFQAVFWALGFMAGAYVLVGRLSFPPHDVNEAFSWAALALAGFVWLSPKPVGSRYLIRALFVLFLGYLALWPIHASLHGQVPQRNLLAFFFLGLGTWSILERASQKVQPLTLLVLPIISATALSMLLLFKGSASLAQLVSVVCSFLGGLAAVAVIFPKRVSLAAVLPFVSVLIVLFMAVGHFYLDINPWHMIYLCLPFLALWMRRWIPFIPHQPIAETVALGVLSGAPLAYFLWNVYQTSGPLY